MAGDWMTFSALDPISLIAMSSMLLQKRDDLAGRIDLCRAFDPFQPGEEFTSMTTCGPERSLWRRSASSATGTRRSLTLPLEVSRACRRQSPVLARLFTVETV
jgi:hypothetical protein